VAGEFTHGWQTNGIFRYVSGDPLTISPGLDTVLQGGGNERVNVIASPLSPASRSFDQQRAAYFRTSAFVLAPLRSFGNEGRNALYKSRPI